MVRHSEQEYESCDNVLGLAPKLRCNFVRNTMACQQFMLKIDYPKFIFCTFGEHKNNIWLAFALLAIIGICLLYLLHLFIRKFFVKTALAVGRMFNFNEYLLVMIVTTMYNFYWMLTSHNQHYSLKNFSPEAMILFVLVVSMPIIMVMVPYKTVKVYVLFDTIFVATNLIWLDRYFAGYKVDYLKSASITFVYISYLIIIYWLDLCLFDRDDAYDIVNREKPRLHKNFQNINDKELFVRDMRYADWFQPAILRPSNEFLFKQFTDDLFKFKRAGIGTPIMVMLRLAVPIIDLRKPCYKWSKLLRIINVILFPVFCWFTLNLPMNNYLYIFPASVTLAVAILFTSRTDRAPKYYSLYALGVIFGYTFIGFGVMSEVRNIISSFFILANVQNRYAQQITFAIFNSIPDVILAMDLIKRGCSKLSLTGCFVAIIFRSYFEMRVWFFWHKCYGDASEILNNKVGPTVSIYGIMQILLMCLGLQATNLLKRHTLAYFMILSYATLFGFSIIINKKILDGCPTINLYGVLMENQNK